jgi:hypothetical protein
MMMVQIAKGVKPTPAKTFETGHTQPVTEVPLLPYLQLQTPILPHTLAYQIPVSRVLLS